ncbi:MAG: FimV/HubP family polar landmark protein [Ferrimonas sp.]
MSHHYRQIATAVMFGAIFSMPTVHAETLPITGPDGQIRLEEPALNTYGPIKSTDTLWRIANQVRPDNSVSIYQVMQALFDANPQAFSSDNFNSLERGFTLRIPSKEIMASYPAAQAKASAERHDNQWPGATTSTVPVVSAPKSTAPSAATNTAEVTKLRADNQRLQRELKQKTDALAKLQGLRVEVDASGDELAEMVHNNTLLQRQMEQLSNELSMLQNALDEQQRINYELELQLEQQRQMAAQNASLYAPQYDQEPASDFWQKLASNTPLLILAVILPILLLLILLWVINRRRYRPISQNPIKDGEMIKPINTTPLDPLTEMVPEMPAKAAVAPVAAAAAVSTATTILASEPTPADNAEQAQAAAAADDILSLDELLKDDAFSAEADTNTDDASNHFDKILADADAEVEALNEQPVNTDPFLDIDQLLAETNEDTPSAQEVADAENIIQSTDILTDESGYRAKLDLARAYIEIDDIDSAKGLLNEVLTDGAEELHEEAKQLLSEL